MPRRRGRPGIVRTMGRTAVIAGTATAVSGGMQRHAASKQQEAYEQDAANQAAYESQAQLAELGLTTADLQRTLQVQNMVVDAGSVNQGMLRFRIAPTGEFASPEEIGNLAVTGRSVVLP